MPKESRATEQAREGEGERWGQLGWTFLGLLLGGVTPLGGCSALGFQSGAA